MISLRRSLSIADSHYFAAAIACRNYVAAVDMTFRHQPLSAIAGSNFAAVDDFSAAIAAHRGQQRLCCSRCLQQLRRCSRYDFPAATAVSHGWQQPRRSRYDFSAAIAVHHGYQLLCCSHCLLWPVDPRIAVITATQSICDISLHFATPSA